MVPATSPRVLVVEDERIVAAALQKQLQQLGYEVPALAYAGEEAVRLAKELRPDLVLMDVQLEGELDGVEAAARVRGLGIPVIYLTAYSNRDTLERAKVTEPYGYILKPYEDRELHVVVETALYKHRCERALLERERWLAAVLNSIGDGVVATDREGRITFLNPKAEQLTGWRADDARGKPLEEVFTLLHQETRQPVEAPVHRAMRERTDVPMANHTVLIARGGQERPVDDTATPILDGEEPLGGVMAFRDVSERYRAQLEARTRDAYLRQAQKMEAIGRLAGGVAHDFNNLLTVINGYTQVLQGMLAHHEKAQELLAQIHKAGERASALTQQLLAYSRKQLLQPRVVDVNAVIDDARTMLSRVIGEDVELTAVLAPNLPKVKADPGQLNQVLMNLCLNARDAMPTGGKLTLETRSILLETALSKGLFEMHPGLYVQVSVSDTGHGMDAETKAHIFEPFFTTKEQGKGTGLGLAMVYGIVKQSDGYIMVYSEPGYGTTFKVYLPAVTEDSEFTLPSQAADVPGGTETVLLAEDEESVRSLTRLILERLGYHVLAASTGPEALQMAAAHPGPIDLLVTDVVMPGMSGRQVAQALRLRNPSLRVLYVSGYTDDAIVRHGVLESEAAFFQKPFSMNDFARKVRQVLDQPV